MTRKRKPAPERRGEILSTARTLFARQGYDSVVMDDIARAAGLARTTLYEYYASKEEILVGLIDATLAELPPLPDPGGGCRQRLTALAGSLLERIASSREVYHLIFRVLPTLSGPVAERLATQRRQEFELVRAVAEAGVRSGELRPDVSPADVAFALLALVGQRGGDLLVLGGSVEPQREAERLVDLLWRGVSG